MPRPNRPIHPLRMIEALTAINRASITFEAKVDGLANILERGPSADASVRKAIAADLRVAASDFRAVIWPEGE